MEERVAAERLGEIWMRYYHEVARPHACVHCAHARVWWDGERERSGSGVLEEHVVTVPRFLVRRVRCAGCRRGWTLLPPGLLPRRHFDLGVAARALADYLFGRSGGLAKTAARFLLSPRTLRRMRDWVADLAPPTRLGAWVAECSGAPLVGTLVVADGAAARCREGGAVLVQRAAAVLCLLESLAAAAGLAAPGLAALVPRAIDGRRALAAYRGALIPADAWRRAAGLSESLSM